MATGLNPPATRPAFILQTALVDAGYRLRPETDADLPFLLALYASTRAEELATIPWSEAQKHAFVAQQFAAQREHYRRHFTTCAFDLIEHDGSPVGRFYLDRRGSRLHIIDITLLPIWRGRGIGTAMLTALIDTAEQSGLGVGIFVEKFNAARALYDRLGFVEIADTGVYIEMERPVSDSPAGGQA